MVPSVTPLDPSPPEPESFQNARRLQRLVEAEMECICNSTAFKTSRKCREFLRYVVQVTLSGRGDSLKERSIAIDLMGCDLSYDPGTDARVRVRAKEVRQRLTTFYAAETGFRECRISLPVGAYVPEFALHEQPDPAAAILKTQASADAIPEPERLVIPRLSVLAMLCPVGIALFFFGFLLRWQVLPASSFDDFWGELLRGKSALAIDIDPTVERMTESIPFLRAAGRFGLDYSQIKIQNGPPFSPDDLIIHIEAESPPAVVQNPGARYMIHSDGGRLHAIDRSTNQVIPIVAIATILPGRPTQMWVDGLNEPPSVRLIRRLTTPDRFPPTLNETSLQNGLVQVVIYANVSDPVVVIDKEPLP
jgi:hypothetical protein